MDPGSQQPEDARGRTQGPRPAAEVVTCPLDAVPAAGCTTAGDGRVLVARVGDGIVAYANACLHRGTPLDGGVVRGGVITCPAHLWRYRLADGSCLNARGGLERLPSRIVDGQVRVELPPPETATIRDRLLAHARTWKRDV